MSVLRISAVIHDIVDKCWGSMRINNSCIKFALAGWSVLPRPGSWKPLPSEVRITWRHDAEVVWCVLHSCCSSQLPVSSFGELLHYRCAHFLEMSLLNSNLDLSNMFASCHNILSPQTPPFWFLAFRSVQGSRGSSCCVVCSVNCEHRTETDLTKLTL